MGNNIFVIFFPTYRTVVGIYVFRSSFMPISVRIFAGDRQHTQRMIEEIVMKGLFMIWKRRQEGMVNHVSIAKNRKPVSLLGLKR